MGLLCCIHKRVSLASCPPGYLARNITQNTDGQAASGTQATGIWWWNANPSLALGALMAALNLITASILSRIRLCLRGFWCRYNESMKDILLKATKFTVERRVFDHPGVGRVRRELVVHPGAVLILPMLSPEKVVLIHNYRFAVLAELLELPAGTLEPGEQPIDCAARELEEETGYAAGHIEPLCKFYTSPGFTDERMYVFLASDLTATAQRLDSTEQIRVAIMDLTDALDATVDGRIVDGKTIASLHLYHYRQSEKP